MPFVWNFLSSFQIQPRLRPLKLKMEIEANCAVMAETARMQDLENAEEEDATSDAGRHMSGQSGRVPNHQNNALPEQIQQRIPDHEVAIHQRRMHRNIPYTE